MSDEWRMAGSSMADSNCFRKGCRRKHRMLRGLKSCRHRKDPTPVQVWVKHDGNAPEQFPVLPQGLQETTDRWERLGSQWIALPQRRCPRVPGDRLGVFGYPNASQGSASGGGMFCNRPEQSRKKTNYC